MFPRRQSQRSAVSPDSHGSAEEGGGEDMASKRSVPYGSIYKRKVNRVSRPDRSGGFVPTHVGMKVESLSVVRELNLWLML